MTSLAASAISARSQNKAANTVADSSRYAADLLNSQYNQTRSDLSPYRAAGESAIGPLAALLGTDPDSTPSGREAANAFNVADFIRSSPSLLRAYESLDSKKRADLQRRYGPGLEGFGAWYLDTYPTQALPQVDAYKASLQPAASQPAPTTGSGVPTTEGGTVLDRLMNQSFAQPAFDAGIKAVEQSAYGSGRSGGGVLKELMEYGTRFGADLRQNEISNLLALMGQGQGAATSTGQFGANTANNVASTMMEGAGARASSYANNPWTQGLGFASGFFSGEGGQDLLQGVGDWWKRRNDPKLRAQPIGGAAKLLGAY